MIAPPSVPHSSLADLHQPVACAATIRAAYDGEFSFAAQPGGLLKLRMTRSGRYALVGWTVGEMGGTSLFEQRGQRWCRMVSGGGALRQADLVGFDGIDAARARRLFAARAVTSVGRVR